MSDFLEEPVIEKTPEIEIPEINEDTDEEYDDDDEHEYATVDCGGECEKCVALIVDGVVIDGPPFHPNCDCKLTQLDINNAKYHKSNLHDDIAPNKNTNENDVKWMKESLYKLGFYKPDERADETPKILSKYPNQKLFEAIKNFQHAHKLKEQGSVKPGHWTEVKINEELKKQDKNKKPMTIKGENMKISEQGIEWLKNLEGFVKINGRHIIYDDATKRPVPTNKELPPGATIGYGHLIQPGEDFKAGLTELQATELFFKDLENTYKIIKEQINPDVLAKMGQHQKDALISFVYNIGPGSDAPYNKNRGLFQSTARKYLNNSKFKSILYPNLESAWKAFNNRGLLNNRRDAEWRLFNNGDYSGY